MDDPHALSTGVEVLEGYSVVCYNPVAAATGEEESSGTDLHSVQLASSTDTITVDCRVWTATLYTAYSCNVTCISDHYLLLLQAMICAASKHVNEIAFTGKLL